MAVSKTFPAESVAEAAALGSRSLAKTVCRNSAQKSRTRQSTGHGPCEIGCAFNFIGHLQSNKAARAAELFDGIDSLDSLRVAERLDEAAGRYGKRLPVLIELKLSPEATKTGLNPESAEAAQLARTLARFFEPERARPDDDRAWGAAEDVTRACFRGLRTWRDRWAPAHPNLHLAVLSMGMSGDFPLAIQEGSTRIRIGTALFGKRPPPSVEED